METKIRYALFELNGRTVFTIFDMDERFRFEEDYDLKRSFIADNGWKIQSVNHPEIIPTEKKIYLRGATRPHDRKIVVLPESSRVKRSEIHEALQDWAKNWEGWKDEEEPMQQKTITVPICEV